MPSRRHEFMATAIPRLRRARDLESEPIERARVEVLHRTRRTDLPTRAVPRFDQRVSLVTEDLGRPEVSPAMADLAGLPTALQLYGSRDLLAPGCRLLAERSAGAGWDLTSIEEPDLPFIPESARAMRQIVEFVS